MCWASLIKIDVHQIVRIQIHNEYKKKQGHQCRCNQINHPQKHCDRKCIVQALSEPTRHTTTQGATIEDNTLNFTDYKGDMDRF